MPSPEKQAPSDEIVEAVARCMALDRVTFNLRRGPEEMRAAGFLALSAENAWPTFRESADLVVRHLDSLGYKIVRKARPSDEPERDAGAR